MATFARPENALKRAEELINVGQKQEALDALHSFITSRRYRAWTRTHERIMFKYVELCVEMRKGRHAKDGLIQYRGICQQVNITSLEEVIKHFMQLATEKAEHARTQAQALEEALDVDDLEADKRPEDLMLSYVSGEKGKDRSDRELVTPWFKFLWETYRSMLEILRNNSRLEGLYAMTAHRAFQFCNQYKRTTEFRRLCEIIRNHLTNLNEYRDQRDRPDLSAPESLQLYLDTRFEQLKVATELGLWQEAFRSIEDIHGLMCLVKKSPKPSLMVIYYSKLLEIFWKSSSHLYHAYAWLKLFSLQKSFNKNLNQKDLQLIASSVVLAALAVPPYDHSNGTSHLELENEKERSLRVSNLIAFNIESKSDSREVLSRQQLLLDLVSKGVLSCATQEVKDLYHILEDEYSSLDLSLKVQPLLTKISKLGGKLASASSVPEVQLLQYVPALEKLATLRLLQGASRVYQTMKIGSLSTMIPFSDFSAVEKISVDAGKNKRHAGDVEEKKRMGRMMVNMKIFQERTLNRRRAENEKLLEESRERIRQELETRKQKRTVTRKMLYFLRTEEERQKRVREEEEARKLEEMERKKKEEAEKKAKLDEIAEKQRQRERELEEKERRWRDEVLGKPSATAAAAVTAPPRAEPAATEAAPAAAAAAAPATDKYVPRFKRNPAAAAEAPPETDRWSNDRWNRRPVAHGSGGGGSRTSWNSSRR